MEIYLWLLIPVIVFALFAGKIDRIVKGNNKVRYIILIFLRRYLYSPLNSLYFFYFHIRLWNKFIH